MKMFGFDRSGFNQEKGRLSLKGISGGELPIRNPTSRFAGNLMVKAGTALQIPLANTPLIYLILQLFLKNSSSNF